ncbi:hypothetical protein ANTQUA_LOCUS8682 [Anthophora quadrimaculata]
MLIVAIQSHALCIDECPEMIGLPRTDCALDRDISERDALQIDLSAKEKLFHSSSCCCLKRLIQLLHVMTLFIAINSVWLGLEGLNGNLYLEEQNDTEWISRFFEIFNNGKM